jgi:AraC-like DNA-binding protein
MSDFDTFARSADLVARLRHSPTYIDCSRAFALSTQMPLALCPLRSDSSALEGARYENPFCALMRQHVRTCAECMRLQEEIGDGASEDGAKSAACFAGLYETAVPVRTGPDLIGFLRTGQVALREPTPERLPEIAEQIARWGLRIDPARLEDAYLHSLALSPRQYVGAIRLLEIFSSQLSKLATQMLTWTSSNDSLLSKRAKAYVNEHLSDPIPLDEISRALHVEMHYFCRMFKKATGLTFTDYVGRMRIEQARQLLLDPHLQVAEVAYSVGFGSLTHFNRVFHRVVGCSPTAYREQFRNGVAFH